METCTRNHRRDIAIILSIIFHLLLCVFLFYKIKKTIEEPEAHKFKDEPIFLSQELASQLVEAAKQDKPKEEPVQVDPAVLASQLVPIEKQQEQESIQDVEDSQEEQIAPASLDTLGASAHPELVEGHERITQGQPKKKIKRRSIMQTENDINVPRLPNVIDYVKEDLKTNLFKLVGDNSNVDMKYLSYRRKIMEMISMSFIALYSGKSLGVPKHEYDLMMRGITLDIEFTINENGYLDNINLNSPAKEYIKCLERAIKYAAPFPKIPKHFNAKTHTIKAREHSGMGRSKGAILSVYPT